MWSLTLGERYKLQVIENKSLEKYFDLTNTNQVNNLRQAHVKRRGTSKFKQVARCC
jgi:hypothetical protein